MSPPALHVLSGLKGEAVALPARKNVNKTIILSILLHIMQQNGWKPNLKGIYKWYIPKPCPLCPNQPIFQNSLLAIAVSNKHMLCVKSLSHLRDSTDLAPWVVVLVLPVQSSTHRDITVAGAVVNRIFWKECFISSWILDLNWNIILGK